MEFKGPRERLLEKGAHTLSDSELLALFLRTGPRTIHASDGPRVLELAKNILECLGGIRGFLEVSKEELGQIHGVGPAKLALLLAVKELVFRIGSVGPGTSLSRPERAVQVFSDIARFPQESVWVAYLNLQNELIRREEIFRGTLSSSTARPREILRGALKANAAKIIVVHNHPSGACDPSAEDIRFTRLLGEAAGLVGVPLVDHLIIGGDGKYFSFAKERGIAPFIGKV